MMGTIMNYLFWNTNKQMVDSEIISIIKEFSCDIIGLAEYNGDIKKLLKSLSCEEINLYHIPQIGCKRIEILCKYNPSKVDHCAESHYYTIKKFPHDTLGSQTIGFVHLPSKLHAGSIDRLAELMSLKSSVEELEGKINNYNTIIVGDFNANPFEEELVGAMSIYCLSDRRIVKKRSKTIRNVSYNMFYNPMWNLLGDKDGIPGTYYYNKSEQVNYFWNIFDQVVIRPEIIDNFDVDKLKIISQCNNVSLVNRNGRPSISDHLPIIFNIS
jgi:hypothetical protein